MANLYHPFKALHEQPFPLLIANVWNAQTALIAQSLGYKAVATSSAAVAQSLGYSDGEQMSFEEYYGVIHSIAGKISIPFSVDLETGYGSSAAEICTNISSLSAIGVCGINIEDSIISGNTRRDGDPESFAALLKTICHTLKARQVDMFINVRSDTFLLNLPDALSESLRRINLYANTGVQGLFFPCLTKPEEISRITQASPLPVSIMCMPGLPGFADLQKAGIKRISMGNFLHARLYAAFSENLQAILQQQNFGTLF